jgi:hypothetical protein
VLDPTIVARLLRRPREASALDELTIASARCSP